MRPADADAVEQRHPTLRRGLFAGRRPGLVSVLGLLPLLTAVSSAAGQTRRDLLLVTLDTVRADHLSCNGADTGRTPNLDRLARGGVNFTRTRASVPLTLPSHASILTGRYPPAHGVRDNGSSRLAETELTLAEVLKEAGYTTAAFIGSFVLDRRFGLDQGFDVYDDRLWENPADLESTEAERSAEAVRDAFLGWLGGREFRRPFFAWVHLFDPHAPYTPPEPYRSRFRESPYAGEIAYSDAVVGNIVDALEARGLLSGAVVAVVGDHGEGLGEHQERTHSLLIYNSTLHVPMLIHAPELIPAGRTVSSLTRTIDLAPTLLDYLEVYPRFGQGTDLRPRIEGETLVDETLAYSESLYPELKLGWSRLRGLETRQYRFILAPRRELYDLTVDPGERSNLAGSRRSLTQALEGRLDQMIKATSSSIDRAVAPLDPAAEARLRSLGYLPGNRQSRALDTASSVDPKDNMEAWNSLQRAIFRYGRGDYSGAIESLNDLLAIADDIPIVHEYLGSSHVRLGQWSEAERVYVRALERGLDTVDLRLDLGLVHHQSRKHGKAETQLRAALALDERSVVAHHRLADVLRSAGRSAEAIVHYRKALEINPSYVYAWNGLGMALSRSGRHAEALAAFREAVQAFPEEPRGHFNLAVQLRQMGRSREALAAYREFMGRSESNEAVLGRERERAAAAIRRLEGAERQP